MSDLTPLRSKIMRLEPEWIDYNGHLNMAFYNVLFDRCVDEVLEPLGLGVDYIKNRNLSFFTAEIHVCYVRELSPGDKVYVDFQLLEMDSKRLRFFQHLREADDGWISATSEQMMLHMDMGIRKVAPFPDDIMENLQALMEQHQQLPWPERAGRAISMQK